MAEIDLFATSLLEEAKRFYEKASDATDQVEKTAHLHASLLLGWCALEAHVNAIADELATVPALSAHERAFLLEKDVYLLDGAFEIGKGLRMVKLEERIQFLHRKFSGSPLNRAETCWTELKTSMSLRNDLTHPKGATAISVDAVRRSLQAIIDTLNELFLAVHKSRFPAASRGLQSMMNF